MQYIEPKFARAFALRLHRGLRVAGLLVAIAAFSNQALAGSSTVELIYDAAGNVKQIKRQAAYGLAITGVA